MLKSSIRLALYQPDIPQNAGSAMRLAACFGAALHIIEPCGFALNAKSLKRVAMDYGAQADIRRHDSWEAFLAAREGARLALLTTKAETVLYDFAFRPGDIMLLGRESAGVPDSVAAACDARLRIPIRAETRSLNLVQAAAVAMGEMARQLR